MERLLLATRENTLRLLEPASHSTGPAPQSIEIFGRKWAISEYAQSEYAPSYTCVSYFWDAEETVSLLSDEQRMSARATSVIETVVNASQSEEVWTDNIQFSHNHDPVREQARRSAALKASQAFWIDAFCVPAEEPARSACLRSMGEIYSSAHQVFAVLSKSCSGLLESISRTGELDSHSLLSLEEEDWIERAWTYQEAVNSRALYFVIEGEENAMVSGQDFLNAMMKGIDKYRLIHKLNKDGWAKRHPRLYRFEALLADYRIADYATRSAYQVMSVMDQRVSRRAEDYHYAMIGAISTKPVDAKDGERLHPSVYFMRVCEDKGDYSFFYSIAPRSAVPGRKWRPVEGKFAAVLPGMTTFGKGQAGLQVSTHLRLDNMYRLRPGSVTTDGLKAMRWFSEEEGAGLRLDVIAAGVLERLRTLGFAGCGEYLEFQEGLFFPQSTPVCSTGFFAVVSRDVDWMAGGPGLCLRSNNTEINDFCGVGAFVGRVPKRGYSINVG